MVQNVALCFFTVLILCQHFQIRNVVHHKSIVKNKHSQCQEVQENLRHEIVDDTFSDLSYVTWTEIFFFFSLKEKSILFLLPQSKVSGYT